jgi:excisionase family DNA binding protein
VPETVKALGISKAKLFRLMAAGDIEGVKIGGRRLFKSEEVDRYVRSLPPSPPLSQISGPRKPS